jgi:competence protein ComGC
MGKHKRLTPIEILLILAIIAVLVVWLFPRFLKILDSNSSAIGTVKPYIEDASGTGSLNRNSLRW